MRCTLALAHLLQPDIHRRAGRKALQLRAQEFLHRLALQAQQAGEAKKLLEDAFASGLLGKGPEAERHKRLLALASERAAEAPERLQQAQAEAVAKNDGSELVRVGLAYTGLGQHDKGIALIQQGIATKGKGKLRADEANLHLGIAYLRAGQKARTQQACGRRCERASNQPV